MAKYIQKFPKKVLVGVPAKAGGYNIIKFARFFSKSNHQTPIGLFFRKFLKYIKILNYLKIEGERYDFNC